MKTSWRRSATCRRLTARCRVARDAGLDAAVATEAARLDKIPGRVDFAPEVKLGGSEILQYVFAVKDPAPRLCAVRLPARGDTRAGTRRCTPLRHRCGLFRLFHPECDQRIAHAHVSTSQLLARIVRATDDSARRIARLCGCRTDDRGDRRGAPHIRRDPMGRQHGCSFSATRGCLRRETRRPCRPRGRSGPACGAREYGRKGYLSMRSS